MGINVTGSNALGDYLISRIDNARVLFGEPTAPSVAALGAASSPDAGKATLPTHAQLAREQAAANLANAQTLFGTPQAAPDSAVSPSALPPNSGQTAHQVLMAGIESSVIAQQFSNTATLFSSLGLGAQVNTSV